jgi:hypothetical protein
VPEEFQHPKQESLIWGRATKKTIKRWQVSVIIFLVIAIFTSFSIVGLSVKESAKSRTEAVTKTSTESQQAFPIVTKVCTEWETLLEKAKTNPLSMEEMSASINKMSEISQNSKAPALRLVTKQLSDAINKSDIEAFKKFTPTLNSICRSLKVSK